MPSDALVTLWTRPANALDWQRQLAELERRSQHLARSVRWALFSGALVCMVNGLWHSTWAMRLAMSSFSMVLFLYPLVVERVRDTLAQRQDRLRPLDPDPAQLTRWQSVPAVVAYRQACLASGVPLLVGDGRWMDQLFAAHRAEVLPG